MKLNTLLLAIAFIAAGCSSNNDVSSQESTDSIRDRTWALTTVQDNTGNQTLILQETDFEFTIRLSSSLVPSGDAAVQEVMSIGGINVCNDYSGGYTLEDGVLTLIAVSETDQACERANELPASIFSAVLFSFATPTMISIDSESDVLTIASGTNEALYFEVQPE